MRSSSTSPKRGGKSPQSRVASAGNKAVGNNTAHDVLTNQNMIDFDQFYAERVAKFEPERTVYKHYLKLIEPRKEESHHLIWQNKKLLEERRLQEVEQAKLQDKIHIIHKETNVLKKEVEDMMKTQIQRQDQLKVLQDLSGPVEHDVTYSIGDHFSGVRKQTISTTDIDQVIAMSVASREVSMNASNVRNSDSLRPSDMAAGNSRQRIRRTTSSSSSSTAANAAASGLDAPFQKKTIMYKPVKNGEVIALERRLQEESLRVNAYLQDIEKGLQRAEEEYHKSKKVQEDHHSIDLQEATSLWKEVDQVEYQNYHAISELLRLRYSIMIAQREEVEELERLQSDKLSFVQREERLKTELLEEMSKVKRRMRHELDETTKEYKHQLADMEVTIQDLYVKEQDIKQQHSQWTEKEEKYAAVLELWKEKYDKLRRRTALQMEGYQNEAMQLRKYLQKLEKQYYQHKQQGVTGVRATQAKSP